MPGFEPNNQSHRQAVAGTSNSSNAEDTIIYLPSELNAADRRQFCPAGLVKMEDRLRHAEASDCLETLRHHLRTRSFANRFKIANVTGQVHNTRVCKTQHTIDDKVRTAELQYRRARDAVLILRGPGEWEEELQVLAVSDVRALNERELTAQEAEDVRKVRARAGVVLDAKEIAEERMLTAAAVVGDSQRIDDPLTRAGVHPLSYYPLINN